ncbi:MAG: Flp pilus assembly complex ATPase component TadA [Candidatus Omnitrophica bacterium]|nr:Flp pilus assembly complex ATPase component TadA [Candidatus Omnitrophota bacterium]
MAESLRKRVIDLLVSQKKLDRSKLEEILQSPRAKEKSLGQLLVDEGVVSQQELLSTLAQGLQMPPISLARYEIDPALAQIVPERMARQHRVVPVSRIGNRLSVAMADPLNVLALDDLAMTTLLEISPVIATERDVEQAIQKLYHPESSLEAISAESQTDLMEEAGLEIGGKESGDEDVVDLTAFGMAGQKAPIVKVVDMMIVEALKARASDIHIEPYEQEVRVRYRVDGGLIDAFHLPKRHQNALTTRLKILSKLDITENRLPQDGRFKVRSENREVDFRVSVLPISFGNKIVMRVLDKSNLSVGLEKLGLLPESRAAFEKAIGRPYGMILITGPTGSGKSTTLYSVLAQMNDPGRNILTIEDPVEYQVEGITQVQVHPQIGLTFPSALRSFLRQAPDVVLVGEIRDGETADIAIKASLTGQIVLSTLHTNDAPSSITRLIDMGVDPFLLASSLIFVAAQRLCRQICPRCKVPDEAAPSRLKSLGIVLEKGQEVYKGKGCAYCRKTGYRGRFAILEAMLVDDRIREMIIARKSSDEIKAYAVSSGMRTLRQEGIVHLLQGRTSVDELQRVTSEDEMEG